MTTVQENEFYAGICVGGQVYWIDPDHDVSSGYYTVHEILSDSGAIEDDDTMLMLKNNDGSNTEVFAHELRSVKPDVLNDAQKAVLAQYACGDFAYMCEIDTREDLESEIENCGDGLLRFLMVELSSSEDCKTLQDAQQRIEAAIRDLQSVSDAIDAVEHKTLSPKI